MFKGEKYVYIKKKKIMIFFYLLIFPSCHQTQPNYVSILQLIRINSRIGWGSLLAL